MPYANNFEELQSMVLSRVENNLKNRAVPKIEKKLAKSAATITSGNTSRNSGGLSDMDMIKTDVRKNKTSVTSMTKDIAPYGDPQDLYLGNPQYDDYAYALDQLSVYFHQDNEKSIGTTYFAEATENGDLMDLGQYLRSGCTDASGRYPAKKFIAPVRDEIYAQFASGSGDIVDAILHGLK